MNLRPVSLIALIAIGVFSGQAWAQSRSTYLVQLAGEPAASYSGNVTGFAATRPAVGARFNARSPAALAYSGYLDAQQVSMAALVGRAPIVARYKTVFNGFAARLTPAEVQALMGNPKVVAVHPDEMRKLETISTSAFLGLSAPGGMWSRTVGGRSLKGEDVIIGIVDSGVWPENAAFSDRVDASGIPTTGAGTTVYGPPPAGWAGTCQAGEGFTPALHCNNKLIGAQFFNAGFIASNYPKHWTEFYSPRDSVAGPNGHGGHGTHTASTAGGNEGAIAIVSGVNMGEASGMAPRARIAVYKVCYTFENPAATDGSGSQNGCWTSDSVAAIDKAVADGVHVINYSISGSQTSVNDPVEQAFLRAANAGVFVAASAGNAGPGNAVAHVSPWLTTVAASTHDRLLSGTVTLGSGASYTGVSVNPTALPAKPVIRAQDAGLAGANPTSLRLCFSSPAVLDPTKVAGKVVVCDRGTNARVDKSLAVLQAGGLGMVLVDNGAGLVPDIHSVPTVHLTAAHGALVKSYAATAGATAAISAFFKGTQPAPFMAGFSSRGPNQGDLNMLKPDVAAPGVDVIAGVTADLTATQRNAVAAGTLVPQADWASYQGTSMSSPHVAGLAALLRQAYPTWTPNAIKSALMTTAASTLNDGLAGVQNGLLPWAQGAGHVVPNAAVDPGLVYDAGPADFTRYQCKVNKAAVIPASDCTTVGTLDQTYNFNLPSITIGSLTGATTVTRRVTNVSGSTATYTASASLPGFSLLVSPSSLTIAPGETKTFTVRITNVSSAENVWSYGSLVWTDGVHSVRTPLTARAGRSISAPSEVLGSTPSGTRLITIITDAGGRISASKGGMKAVTLGAPATLAPAQYTSAELKTACAAGFDTANLKVYPVSIAAGTLVARFELRQSDVSDAGDDNDMGLLAPNGGWLYSGNEASNESIQVTSPAAGNYKLCVTAWGGAPAMTHRLSSWVVTPADASSSLNVLLPGTVYAGSTATVGVAWSRLAADGRYLGGFQLKDASGVLQTTTTVRVNTGAAALPLAATERAVTTQGLRK
jgi:subtilisin family serine protease